MLDNLTHEELQAAYLELQSRVTRFSSTEQALINTRDQLDQERTVYQRMNRFHTEAIETHHVPALLTLVAETVVDLFETEMGYAAFRCSTRPERNAEHLEGGRRFLRDALQAECWKLVDQAAGSTEEWVDENVKGDGPMGRRFLGRRIKGDPQVELVIVGAVSREMDRNYEDFNPNTETLLTLFADSCSSYLHNIISTDRINEQLETIRISELEQRKLSLIATKTQSGVIITDSHGCIEWVNEAFMGNTGYSMEEVLGRKPKEFLQVGSHNAPETMEKLSGALRNHEHVSVSLCNRRKNGEEFHINLNISPVFDQDQKLINFIAIQQDITEQKGNERRIVEQNDALTKINQELDHFVYSISHDLRAPLLSIEGLLGLIEPEGDDAENQEYLDLIEQSVKRLDNTIMDILNYSRNARLDVIHAEYDLRHALDTTLRDLVNARSDVRVEVHWNGPNEAVLDELRVGVLLKNVLSNAIKYSRTDIEDAHVLIEVDNGPDACRLRIQDNGEGIAAEHVDKVFDMFFRATNSSSGTGLGLYICKEVADKIGGTITLESEQGLGTEVTLVLPQNQPS